MSDSTDTKSKKLVLKSVDMVGGKEAYVNSILPFSPPNETEELQATVTEIALTACEKYTVEKDIAAYIKKELDQKNGITWHCIVGRNFGSYVTHETKHFIYFYVGPLAILAYKTS